MRIAKNVVSMAFGWALLFSVVLVLGMAFGAWPDMHPLAMWSPMLAWVSLTSLAGGLFIFFYGLAIIGCVFDQPRSRG